MKAARARSHPDFLQRLLQIDDDLAAVVKAQRDHAAGTLVVDVGVRFIIDAVASTFYRLQNGFGQVQVFELGHYNPIMFALLLCQTRILGRRALAPRQHGLAAFGLSALLLLALMGCGQKGPLFLPPGQAMPPTVVPAPNTAAPVLQAPAAVKAPAAP
jgi:predicted small lipoprotein YifL